MPGGVHFLCAASLCCLCTSDLGAEEQALLEDRGGGCPAEGETAEHRSARYWKTGACLVGPARPSELAGGLVSLIWALYEFGPPARRMGIRPLGFTHAECIVCWLLACHLEAISTEMVSSTCCALSVARGQPSTAWSREPGAFRFLSDFQFKTQRSPASQATPASPSLPPSPALLDPESNNACGEILAPLPCFTSCPLYRFEGKGL